MARFAKSCRSDFEFYASRLLRVKPKKPGLPVPFIVNRAQRYVHAKIETQLQTTGRVRVIGLKARQQGFSTYVQGRFFRRTTMWHGYRAFILTHEDKATRTLFGMAKTFYDALPGKFRLSVDSKNANEMVFTAMGSGYGVATAGSQDTGRSQMAQLFHGSEVAFWKNPEDHMAGIGQIVPNAPGTEIILESTGNGIGNPFHKRWQEAESGASEYLPIFTPWFWSDEYREPVPEGYEFLPEDIEYGEQWKLDPNQLLWRRQKINGDLGGDKALFGQEYPSNSVEAFISSTDSYIPGGYIMAARKRTGVKGNATLIIGADPSRYGDDRFGLCMRRGRLIERIWALDHKVDTMEAAGMLAVLINQHKPARMFIDVVGLGAGVFDRLKELGYGHIVMAVEAGSKADEPALYINKRAEMWGRMKKWYEDAPCQVPDEDAHQADKMGPRFKYDSNQRLKIESKDEMRARQVRSPDLADAEALTHAYAVQPVPLDGDPKPFTLEPVPWQVA